MRGTAKKQKGRIHAILRYLEMKGFATTDELSSTLKVTPQTIRRDIWKMHNEGLAINVHGGVRLLFEKTIAHSDVKQTLELEKKKKIAKATAALVPNGASLFLSICSATEEVARELLHHDELHVVTNNIHVGSILSGNPSFQVVVPSGNVRSQDATITSNDVAGFVDQYRLDMCIIGTNGIDEDGTLTDFDDHDVRTAQIIIRNSKKSILVADTTKFGRRAMITMGHLSEIDIIVTDGDVAAAFRDICERNDVKIIATPNEK